MVWLKLKIIFAEQVNFPSAQSGEKFLGFYLNCLIDKYLVAFRKRKFSWQMAGMIYFKLLLVIFVRIIFIPNSYCR
jgi:hypothetical protein